MKKLFYKYMNEQLYKEAVQIRRRFHRNPETAWEEYETSCCIAEKLKEYGFTVYTGNQVCEPSFRMGVPEATELKTAEETALRHGADPVLLETMRNGLTGVVGVLHGTGRAMSKETITVLRFDMDALPVKEERYEENADYVSGKSGVMHACGHDGHTAAGLALARILSMHIAEFSGEIRMIFQPAEEGCMGAAAIIKKGWLTDADYLFGGHIGIQCRVLGEIAACTGGFLATSKLNAEFFGKAAHAGKEPEKGRNALLTAVDFISDMQKRVKGREQDMRMNVGTFHSGTARNIVPDYALLELETRASGGSYNQQIKDMIKESAEASAERYDTACSITLLGEAGTSKSSKRLIEKGYACAEKMGIGECYRRTADFGASEDITLMMNEVQMHGGQAAYFMFGSELHAEHHQSAFNFNEEVLAVIAEFFARLLLDPEDK